MFCYQNRNLKTSHKSYPVFVLGSILRKPTSHTRSNPRARTPFFANCLAALRLGLRHMSPTGLPPEAFFAKGAADLRLGFHGLWTPNSRLQLWSPDPRLQTLDSGISTLGSQLATPICGNGRLAAGVRASLFIKAIHDSYSKLLTSASGPRAGLPGPVLGQLRAEISCERTKIQS